MNRVATTSTTHSIIPDITPLIDDKPKYKVHTFISNATNILKNKTFQTDVKEMIQKMFRKKIWHPMSHICKTLTDALHHLERLVPCTGFSHDYVIRPATSLIPTHLLHDSTHTIPFTPTDKERDRKNIFDVNM